MTIITLSNGKRVANFSSPHPFTFTDGSVLPAVSDDEAERLKVTFYEDVAHNGDVELTFALSDAILEEMEIYILAQMDGLVDVVFCPLPMITALHAKYSYKSVRGFPFRSVRIEDRIKKLVSIEKQCL